MTAESLVEDPLLKVSRVAELFDRTPYTIRQWLKDGTLHGTKIKTQWFVRTSEVNRLAQEIYGPPSTPLGYSAELSEAGYEGDG